MAVAVATALLDTPNIPRLGLMLGLERWPTEATARTKFLPVRQVARRRIREAFATLAPQPGEASVRQFPGADGLFIASKYTATASS
jgi:hypothetical protein